jgi:hypothetical protein
VKKQEPFLRKTLKNDEIITFFTKKVDADRFFYLYQCFLSNSFCLFRAIKADLNQVIFR